MSDIGDKEDTLFKATGIHKSIKKNAGGNTYQKKKKASR